MKLEDYYSVKAAAQKAGIPYMALHQRIHRGNVPVVRLGDRIILIHKRDVAKLKPARPRITLPWREDDPTRCRNHPLYTTYRNMLRRCYLPRTPGYEHWGGRGIKVCDRWLNSFKDFTTDMGPKPGSRYSIDRFPDCNGNYEPSNCRWDTSKQQADNQRKRRGR